MSPWQHLCEYTPIFLSLRVLLKAINGGSWGGWKLATVIPTLQRLDIGSTQCLMTIWQQSNTFWACHHGNIYVYVSIPPDFGVWGSLKAINGGSWTGWKLPTVIPTLQRLDIDIGSTQCLMTLWQQSNTFRTRRHGNIYVSIPPDFWVFEGPWKL